MTDRLWELPSQHVLIIVAFKQTDFHERQCLETILNDQALMITIPQNVYIPIL